jgi:uncharacterized membrane protein YdbT with pleckstrin-like domain
MPSPPGWSPEPRLWNRLGDATVNRFFWIQRRRDSRVTWRKHWIRLLARIWLPLLLTVILSFALGLYLFVLEGTALMPVLILAGLLVMVLGWLWWGWEDWGNDHYTVTNDRIIDTEALPLGFRSKRTETTFDRIQNVSFEIPNPVATALNYGTVMIHTAGAEGRLDFQYVRHPSAVQEEIFRRMTAYERGRREEQREERLADMSEWFAVYDQARRP